jgi:hypothetical protein
MAKKVKRRSHPPSPSDSEFTEIDLENLEAIPPKGGTLEIDEDGIKALVARLDLPRNVVEWLLLHRVMYYLPLGKADLLEAFKEIVLDYIRAGEKTVELPTDVLVVILKTLDRKRSGKPLKTWDRKIDEWLTLIDARDKLRRLRAAAIPAGQALERVARELKRSPLFAKNNLTTIKSRLQRRTFR